LREGRKRENDFAMLAQTNSSFFDFFPFSFFGGIQHEFDKAEPLGTKVVEGGGGGGGRDYTERDE
jgi:hypothetical protein